MAQLVQDLIQWTHDCEHINNDYQTATVEGGDSINQSNTSNTSNESDSAGEGSPKRPSFTNRTPIIDYNDVQPFIDTSKVPVVVLTHHESLQEQNDSLQREIQKWHQSMARIRICNQREAAELLCHQWTLRKVVERIQASSFEHQGDVLRWYEYCQREAERCGSFSETEAVKICFRCHSRLSTDEADSEQECIEDEEKHTNAVDIEKSPTKTGETEATECPATPSTVATAAMTDSPPEVPFQAPPLPETDSAQVAKVASSDDPPPHHHHPSAADIAAANVEDPPDIILPTATNIKETSLMQVQPGGRLEGCGSGCRIM
ncbi:hypothetical protein IV203_032116 [Nitzschia inconspicua]|uniref:Uncharacterized protein n=1 Tax=Nitzschia inconspicua TaxID=303405 RepID=A0A9K3Q384_9STRA|nr:hypothetical protein IV203_032116 [Nitzschia inconspicua]